MSWSKKLKEKTREIFDELPVSAFMRDNRCHMKNENSNYGYITMQNALQDKYIVESLDTDGEYVIYDTVDELIDAGWVVD